MQSKLKTFIVAITSIGLIISLGAAIPVAAQVVISDDFNDNSPDLTLWTVIGNVTETGGQLVLTGGEPPSGVLLNFPFAPGNFDIQVDYKLLNWPVNEGPTGGLNGLSGAIDPNDDPDYQLYRASTEFDNYYGAEFDLDAFPIPDPEFRVPTFDTSGRLRITGVGPTIATYFWSGGGWDPMLAGDFPERLNEPVQLFLGIDTSTGIPATIAFDNFIFYGVPLGFTIEVTIDIKPGSYPNSINLDSAGVIPVAILSSDGFDATTVDAETVSLAGASVKMVGKSGKYLAHEEDVNGDGLVDLVCQVYTEEFMIDVGETTAVLEAETFDGMQIWGEDSLRIVPDN